MKGPKPIRWAWAMLVVGGCAAARPAWVDAPPVTVDAAKAVGSPLATTAAPVAAVRADDLIGLDVTWIALQRFPANALTSLDAQSSLASAPLAQGAVLTRGHAARLVRFGGGLAASALFDRLARRQDGPVQQVGHQIAWVAPGTTVRLRCAADTPRRSITVAVYRPVSSATTTPSTGPTTRNDTAAFAISLAGLSATQPSEDAADGPETAYLDRLPLSPDTPYALLLPWPDGGGPWTALAAYLQVLPPDAASAATAAGDWNRFLEARGGAPDRPTTLPGEHLTLHRAIDALSAAADPRPALTYLASITQARVAADVALVADANLLGKLRDAIIATDTTAATPESVGWLLDRTTLLTLADAASKAPLPPEMVAALAVHAGEVGRHPDTLAEVVKSVGNANDLHTRLVGENYVELEDNAAAARVRAFDWLQGDGRAPAGYDPLGPARARRAAISRAISTPGVTP